MHTYTHATHEVCTHVRSACIYTYMYMHIQQRAAVFPRQRLHLRRKARLLINSILGIVEK